METIIRDKLVIFLQENIMIKNSQHDFRKKRSCLTNLHDIYDETKSVDMIYLGFQKVFDKVPYKRLLKELELHGITGKILK